MGRTLAELLVAPYVFEILSKKDDRPFNPSPPLKEVGMGAGVHGDA